MNLITNNLTTGYKNGKEEITISSNLNLHFEEGDLVSLLGCNGGGKSTFLKTLGGFLPPLKGEILLGNNSLNSLSAKDLSRLVSVVLTGRLSNMVSDVREIVGMGRAPYTGRWGNLSKEDYEIVDKALELVGISDLSERTISSLSDGEYQKVMIAKALAQDTPLILLDEPSAFLDFPSKVELMAILKSLAQEEQKIIIQSTHDLNIAMPLSSKLFLMDKRIGWSCGTKEEIVSTGEISRYFSSPHLKFDKQSTQFILQ